jgi:hypothetical protein
MEDFNVISDTEMDRLNSLFETALEQLIRYEVLVNIAVANMRVNGNEYMTDIAQLIDSKHKEILDEQTAKLFNK